MFAYKIGYDTREESSYQSFLHEKKFSQNELTNVVAECMAEVAKNSPPNVSSVQDCMPDNDAFLQALAKRGFRPVEYEQQISLDGWEGLDKTNLKAGDATNDVLKIVQRKLNGKAWRMQPTTESQWPSLVFASNRKIAVAKLAKAYGCPPSEIKLVKHKMMPESSTGTHVKTGKKTWTIDKPQANVIYLFCPDSQCGAFFDKKEFKCEDRCPRKCRKGVWCQYCNSMIILDPKHSSLQGVSCICGAYYISVMGAGKYELVRKDDSQ